VHCPPATTVTLSPFLCTSAVVPSGKMPVAVLPEIFSAVE
jgi:hypothetical protein